MRRTTPGLLANLLLTLAACAAALALLEGGLRLVEPGKLVPNKPTNIALSEKRNELDFLARNRHRAKDAFGRHDPWLGWDAAYDEHRVRGGIPASFGSGLTAVAVGDSFVFGNEVAAHENFPALLQAAGNGLDVLNMGVPGYGLDQSFLKYVRYGARHNPDIVLFGIYVPDYERAVLRFTAAAKPRFEPGGTGMRVANRPVPDPAAAYARIQTRLAAQWRLPTLLGDAFAALATDDAAFFYAGDRITRHVLTSLKSGLQPGQRLLVIHFPRGESFTDPDPFYRAMSERLMAAYRETGVTVLDLSAAFLAEAPREQVAERFYVIRESGSIGHLNPAGHRLVARAISQALGLTPRRPPPPTVGGRENKQYHADRLSRRRASEAIWRGRAPWPGPAEAGRGGKKREKEKKNMESLAER